MWINRLKGEKPSNARALKTWTLKLIGTGRISPGSGMKVIIPRIHGARV
jgi:hypothetical protein